MSIQHPSRRQSALALEPGSTTHHPCSYQPAATGSSMLIVKRTPWPKSRVIVWIDSRPPRDAVMASRYWAVCVG